jgi:hypothetical protein
MGFGPEYNNRSSFGESLDRMNDEFEPKLPEYKPELVDACEHKFKFSHSSHCFQWDVYVCEKCGYDEFDFWNDR